MTRHICAAFVWVTLAATTAFLWHGTETVKAQELAPQAVYILDHPIDPDLLILATPDGRYPFTRVGTDCDWVHSDMNVSAVDVQGSLWQLSGSDSTVCTIVLGDRVDATPCFASPSGTCDINAGEHYWPSD